MRRNEQPPAADPMGSTPSERTTGEHLSDTGVSAMVMNKLPLLWRLHLWSLPA